MVLSTHNSVLSTSIKRPYGFQPSSVVLCIQNSDLRTKIACLYGSQTSPVIFCMQNSVPSIRITSLYGYQPSSNPHVWFLDAKQQLLDWDNNSLWVPDITCRFVHEKQRNYYQNYCIYWSHPLSVVFAIKIATFGAELQVSMGPRPHLSFCACKTA